jgi:hypothetical protein
MFDPAVHTQSYTPINKPCTIYLTIPASKFTPNTHSKPQATTTPLHLSILPQVTIIHQPSLYHPPPPIPPFQPLHSKFPVQNSLHHPSSIIHHASSTIYHPSSIILHPSSIILHLSFTIHHSSSPTTNLPISFHVTPNSHTTPAECPHGSHSVPLHHSTRNITQKNKKNCKTNYNIPTCYTLPAITTSYHSSTSSFIS